MRVISGTAKSLQLKTLPGNGTRPTTDRIKETLFNILANELYDGMFLDLCSGSGAIGIEALSRGAKRAYFVEQEKAACLIIQENLIHTGLKEKAVILQKNAVSALNILKKEKISFDFIFMDPPYESGLEKQLLFLLAQTDVLKKSGMVIVEANIHTSFDYLEDLGFFIKKIKKYKTSQHLLIQRKEIS